jgi:SAM-dependent methyltransferase
MPKAPLGAFLARNPFGDGFTDGLFYREKMRAIHRVAPARLSTSGPERMLDVGGGRSGLARLLYPDAEVVVLDLDPALADQGPQSAGGFVCGDARRLPFADGAFDAVGLFDVLEHVQDDRAAAAEALRVTRPGGVVLLSTPTAAWRYPYFPMMRPLCPLEGELMAEWGHVRRGYAPADLVRIFGHAPERRASFINPLTAFAHDVAFSRLGRRQRRLLHLLAAPATVVGYLCHHPALPGTETALAWRR